MYSKEELEARKKLIAVAQKCLEYGLTVGTWGNLSVRLDREKILITPSGFEKSALKPEHLLVVNLDGVVLKGELKPSVETWLHTAIYKAREDVNAVIHTHSPYATLFASVNEPIPVITVDFAAAVGHEVPVTKYVPPGSKDLAEEVVRVLGKDKSVVLIRNHGAVAVGKDLENAYHAALLLENEAAVYFRTKLLEKVEEAKLPLEEVERLHSIFVKAYGQKGGKITLKLE